MKFNKKVVVIISVLCVCMIAITAGVIFYKSQEPRDLRLKKQIKYMILNKQVLSLEDEILGLDNIEKVEIYENNKLVKRKKLNYIKDNKKIYFTKDKKRLIDYSKGYKIDIPLDTKLDFSYSTIYNTATLDGVFKAIISHEYSPYYDVDSYVDTYLNNFITNDTYQRANDITLFENTVGEINGNSYRLVNTKINNLTNYPYDGYAYITIRRDGRFFYRIMVKYDSDIESFKEKYLIPMINSFSTFEVIGESFFDGEFNVKMPQNWTDETKNIYNTIKTSDKIRWGIFSKDIYNKGISETIPKLEQELNYQFPVVLSYLQFKNEFPTEFMKKNYSDGKLVELTYQITESNNENLYGYTPNLDIYRGVKDDEIRKVARAAKEFGHPFLFRLNNEMNSDWTSYGGVTHMSDPEIFIENWRRFYSIFQEEGANNVIWVFNPNDRNHPPCQWNNFLAYYPGDEYVQMIGVTGYNNGTYYKEEKNETWREFEEIYDEIELTYKPYFNKFPWIITEFSSSSIGGDKAKWIDDMFDCIEKYKNIKIAVWFDYADFDYREGKENIASRPYWLAQTPETTEAFKRGISKNGLQSWVNE